MRNRANFVQKAEHKSGFPSTVLLSLDKSNLKPQNHVNDSINTVLLSITNCYGACMPHNNFSLRSFQKYQSMRCCDQRHWTFVGSAASASPVLAASELRPGPFLRTFLGHVPRSHLTDVTLQIFPSYSKCCLWALSSTSIFSIPTSPTIIWHNSCLPVVIFYCLHMTILDFLV